MKRLALLVVLLIAGVVAAVAVAAGTATVNTYTYTVPGYTVGPQTYVQTVTVPTVTETVTVAGTTAPTTTTQPSTTTASSSPTFASETAYTQSRPAFTATNTINVSDATSLRNAVANLKAGDLVKATADFTVSGSGTSNVLTINKQLSAPAVIDLSGHVVKLAYSGTAEESAVALLNPVNVRIYGGDLSTGTGGACIAWFSGHDSLWWGFTAHNCGADGLRLFTGNTGYPYTGPVVNNDIEGDVSAFGQNRNWDNHNEKCTGLHGANVADGNFFPMTGNRIALNVHDSACEGAGISFGSNQSSNIPDRNTIILACSNLTFVSTIQTGGNCYQTWGYGNRNTDIKYLSATDLAGHPYFANGLYSGVSLASDSVDYGRALNVRQNSRYAGDRNWDTKGGTAFRDVAPLP